MENNVDIVVTWMQHTERWEESFKYWKSVETGLDKESISKIKYRDWDVFNYFFRSVEKFAPWFHKIFLVVNEEDQVPSWLKIDNPKLRIVYIREYLPEELLPTFNITPIELFLCKIPDLSDNYIYCCDDYLFIKPIEKEFFVKDGVICLGGHKVENKPLKPIDLYYKMLNNNLKFLNDKIPNVKNWYTQPHFQTAHNKLFELEFVDKYYEDIMNHCRGSKFRSDKNLINNLYNDFLRYLGKCNYNPNMYDEVACYSPLKNWNTFKYDNKVKLVCFNDAEEANFEVMQKKYKNFLDSILPEKCSFEND